MNYTELTNAIQSYSEYSEADFVADIPNFVRSAEERIFRGVELPCARKSATGNCVTSTQTITLPADTYWPQMLLLTVSGSQIPLLNKEEDWLIEAYGGSTSGTPIYYAIQSDSLIRLAPTPSSTFAYEFKYHGLPTSIVSAATSWLGTYANNALLYGSLVEAAIYMRQDEDILGAYESHFQDAMTTLVDQGKYRYRKDLFKKRDPRPVPPANDGD